MIDREQQKKFEEVWDRGNYRCGSTAQRLVKRIMEVIPETATINDYGCGTGRAEMEILKTRPDQEIRMIDIAPNAPEFSFPENISFYLADLASLNGVPHADWGLCINTLMLVQPEKLDLILIEIRRTCDNLFFEAYDFDDFRLGRNYTTIKMNGEEWGKKLSGFWPNIAFEKSPESERRYIFVCRDKHPIQDKHKGQVCHIVGRGPSLLKIRKEHFGPGPVIVLNEAIQNIFYLGLDNPIYSQWRNGDILSDLYNYLRPGNTLFLFENQVLNDPPSSKQFKDWPDRITFECRRDFGIEPPRLFSHWAALEIGRLMGCTEFKMMGFDSYLGENQTVLGTDLIKSEYRPGDYNEQIEIIKKRSRELDLTIEWFFPEEKKVPIFLNLGCGELRKEGYINIDLHDPGADRKMNALALKFETGSVEEIFSSHLLEHFSRFEVPLVLAEWNRVLKVDGFLKMDLPNLEWCLKNWLDQPEEKRWGFPLHTIFGLQTNEGEFHKTGFTRSRLESLLYEAGFRDIQITDHWSHDQQCFRIECRKAKPMITAITCSGDRPEAFELCTQWVRNQTRRPDQWIVVDDGKIPLNPPLKCDYICREPQPDDPAHTMLLNMKEAMKYIKGDLVVILEDDEYYAPTYIEEMVKRLESYEVVGIGRSKYYHLPTGGFIVHNNLSHASLAQTAFRRSFLPEFMKLLEGDTWLDVRLWQILNGPDAHLCDALNLKERERKTKDGRGIVFDDGDQPLYIGLKGLPGRKGIGSGHNPAGYLYKDSPVSRVLREWCSVDFKKYLDLKESLKCQST